MRQPLAIAALAAAASALLYLAYGSGMAVLPLFAYFVQLPLLFVGLALGVPHAGLTVLLAVALVGLLGGWLAAAVYLVLESLPSLLVTRLALLSRRTGDGGIEWYPPGLLVGQLLLYCLATILLGLLAVQLFVGDVATMLANALRETLAMFGIDTSGMAPPAWLPVLPGILGLSWLLMTCINAVLAQKLAERAGMAIRPSPAFLAFAVAPWTLPALVASALATAVLGGTPLFFAATALVLFSLPYLFQGLAVVHVLA
ncbi:MAG TPA: DUF2232 domain-containing protein, partial [Rhodospirillales bacterium]|nr:DUF2232 domain-containing protein [Rhodospirillales bacterium]